MKATPLNRAHRDLGARMVDFGGWDMLFYAIVLAIVGASLDKSQAQIPNTDNLAIASKYNGR